VCGRIVSQIKERNIRELISVVARRVPADGNLDLPIDFATGCRVRGTLFSRAMTEFAPIVLRPNHAPPWLSWPSYCTQLLALLRSAWQWWRGVAGGRDVCLTGHHGLIADVTMTQC
jgi:hypothetical protein